MSDAKKTIWIDLENSPHVFFFRPIIGALEGRGYKVFVTARDCMQTFGLADKFKLKYLKIGRHYGKNKVMKVYGLLHRTMELAPHVLKHKPVVAVSHCSRSQIFTATLMGIPTVSIYDYEHSTQLKATWGIIPSVIPDSAMRQHFRRGLLKYPGIKEDVYVPDFKPDPNFNSELGLLPEDLVVTIRPPATEAHYHNPKSDALFEGTMEYLRKDPRTKVVILPRGKVQAQDIKNRWKEEITSGKFIIPAQVVDGLNLIFHSDLVISGGGTMNREAAALGVPVYSTFKGKMGAVDIGLSKEGRLILLDSVDDLPKIDLSHRDRSSSNLVDQERMSLNSIVNTIISITEKEI